ncbi:uncharacterized protein EI90DRAFT_3155855 [Cantharellus anzutake]|uniref:uncharacterized protein n=1 Tax=Cantharellus anzutake TaxID=1750568 RepID=UPI0019039864|nr:uncharacterized protein EI90DRAFT_3155855 [Cantharellus anzutake]KAF8328107.1 hypothetical protein EI90DRAFT_3155855 [Cantharellus anzutake]
MTVDTEDPLDFPKLPHEILLHVIALLDSKSLIAAMGVNRFFADEIERIIYRSISVSSTDGRHGKIRAALVKKHQRTAYVQKLEIIMDNPTTFTSELVLTTFVNVRSLSIIPSSKNRSTPALTSLTQCTFPHLTHFRSTWSLNDPSFRTFLKAHSSLKRLELGKSFSTFMLPTSFPQSLLPKLEELDGHWSNVVRLVKGRPVSRISIRSANMASYVPHHRLERILPIISDGSGSEHGVQRLAVHVKEIDPSVVSLIARELPNLTALELVDCSHMELEDTATLLNKVNGIAEAMRGFNALKEIRVSGVVLPSSAVSRDLAEVLGRFSSGLERFVMDRCTWVRRDDGWEPY